MKVSVEGFFQHRPSFAFPCTLCLSFDCKQWRCSWTGGGGGVALSYHQQQLSWGNRVQTLQGNLNVSVLAIVTCWHIDDRHHLNFPVGKDAPTQPLFGNPYVQLSTRLLWCAMFAVEKYLPGSIEHLDCKNLNPKPSHPNYRESTVTTSRTEEVLYWKSYIGSCWVTDRSLVWQSLKFGVVEIRVRPLHKSKSLRLILSVSNHRKFSNSQNRKPLKRWLDLIVYHLTRYWIYHKGWNIEEHYQIARTFTGSLACNVHYFPILMGSLS